jgi:CheY-like chemotaxis protein
MTHKTITPKIDPLRYKAIKRDTQYSRLNTNNGQILPNKKRLTAFMKTEFSSRCEEDKGESLDFNTLYKSDIQKEEQVSHTLLPINLDKEACILIAEDEFLNYLYLEGLFENYPFKLIHAKNGDEAINLVKNNCAIDLVLMDIKMPIKNGLEATIEIRQSNKEIPIIALTAYTSAEDRQNAVNVGCNDYITKPFHEKKIIEMVEKYIKGTNKT